MVGGDFMSVYYSSDHRGYYSATENVGGRAQIIIIIIYLVFQ